MMGMRHCMLGMRHCMMGMRHCRMSMRHCVMGINCSIVGVGNDVLSHAGLLCQWPGQPDACVVTLSLLRIVAVGDAIGY